MNKKVFLIFILFGSVLLSVCNRTPGDLKIDVTKYITLSHLSSSSGVVYHNNHVFVVGDDIPWMFILDNDLNVVDKVKLSQLDSLVNNRIPKSFKPDFESMEMICEGDEKYLLTLSSGSVIHSRDTAYLTPLGGEGRIVKKNVRPVYEKIKREAGIGNEDEINIEGLAIDMKHAYLLHRGNISGNFIARIERSELISYLKNDKESIPRINIFQVKLPVYKNIPSGFSGACMLNDGKGILFTASLEETDDVVGDGVILGSYIGIIPIEELHNGNYKAGLVTKNGKILAIKLEGITVHSVDGKGIKALAVCDNDDGASDFFEMEITF